MNKIISLAIILFISGCTILQSQPKFKIHLTGGYNLPLPDLKGDITDSSDFFNTYSMKTGFGFGADAKFYLGRNRNLALTLSASYQMFSTSEDSITFYIEIGHFTARDFKYKLNALTIGFGIEYDFLPKGKANPFIGAEFTGHFFSGNYEYTSGSTQNTADLTPATRFGFAAGAGVDIALGKSFGIIVGGKYYMANLIGKDSTGEKTNEYGLDDKEYTNLVGDKVSARNINYIQAYLGISFYLNQPKKVVKK